MRYLSLVAKNSLRNKRRTILTVMSVAISFCLLGVLMALYTALFLSDAETDLQARRLVTRHKVSLANVMPGSYEAQIRQVPGIQAVATYQWFGGVYKDSRDQRNFFARFATDPVKFFEVYPDYLLSDEEKKAFAQDRQGCIVGDALAARFGWKIGDHIPIQGDIFPVEFDFIVRGIYRHPSDNESLMFHLESLYQSLPAGRRDFAGTFAILTESAEAAPRVAATIDEMFRNSTAPTRTESEKQFAMSFLSFIGNVKLFLMALCAAVTFTILLVSANTMAMSVRERFREIGILKTLGFTRQAVLGIILGEASFIALIGGVIGLALASMLCVGMRSAPAFITELKTLSLQPGVAAVCLVGAVLLGVVSSVVPATSASRAPIVDSLRFTD